MDHHFIGGPRDGQIVVERAEPPRELFFSVPHAPYVSLYRRRVLTTDYDFVTILHENRVLGERREASRA